MASYRVNLDVFAGPMDLLLYLIRKEEVDIYDIPIAKITDQYIRYIEMLKSLDIDLAGDFLVMASTLMHIKSSMLLPKAEADELEAEDFEDPRAGLIRQLLEYKKFKDAANMLDAFAEQQQQRAPRPSVIIDRLKESTEPEVDLDEVSVWDLLESFDAILQATGANFDMSHIRDDTPIDLYQIELLHRLQTEGAMPFARIFESAGNRLVMIGLFLAMLELIRDGFVGVEQDETGGDIHVSALTDEPAEQVVQSAMSAARQEEDEATGASGGQRLPIVQIEDKNKISTPADTSEAGRHRYPIAEMPAEEGEKNKGRYDEKSEQDAAKSDEN